MPPPVPADALWSEFALGRDPELWEQLAPEFERLARSVAAVFARSDYEREALFRVALVALVKALDRYRPRPGMSFAAPVPKSQSFISSSTMRSARMARWIVPCGPLRA